MVARTEAFQVLWDHSEGSVVFTIWDEEYRSILVRQETLLNFTTNGFDFSERTDLEFEDDLYDGTLELLSREEMAEW